jgi:hypothetical protein
MCAAVLTLEAIPIGLSAAVMKPIEGTSTATALGLGLGLAVLCLLVAGMLRRPWGYYAGWAVQVAAVALGLLVPMMFLLGGIFALLWGMADFLGRKIERERAAAFAAYDAMQAPRSAQGDL